MAKSLAPGSWFIGVVIFMCMCVLCRKAREGADATHTWGEEGQIITEIDLGRLHRDSHKWDGKEGINSTGSKDLSCLTRKGVDRPIHQAETTEGKGRSR